jgi:hypothetical protein
VLDTEDDLMKTIEKLTNEVAEWQQQCEHLTRLNAELSQVKLEVMNKSEANDEICTDEKVPMVDENLLSSETAEVRTITLLTARHFECLHRRKYKQSQ